MSRSTSSVVAQCGASRLMPCRKMAASLIHPSHCQHHQPQQQHQQQQHRRRQTTNLEGRSQTDCRTFLSGFFKDRFRTAHIWIYRERETRAYNGGLETKPPAEVRGQSPQWSSGVKAPWSRTNCINCFSELQKSIYNCGFCVELHNKNPDFCLRTLITTVWAVLLLERGQARRTRKTKKTQSHTRQWSPCTHLLAIARYG